MGREIKIQSRSTNGPGDQKTDVIFLSAQPDELYFIWQLEVQLQNFKRIGIKSENVHILVGIKCGPSSHLMEFENSNDFGQIFMYPDDRINPIYASGIRPHLIRKHFERFPQLKKIQLFYHDCDIIFREIPDFSILNDKATWYVSDTRSYISSVGIKNLNPLLLKGMCDIIGIHQVVVEMNDGNAGGAQYLLTGTDSSFWKKVEQDAERLFSFLRDQPETGRLQVWCADMWALLWNAWLFNYRVEIHRELSFCWPHQPLAFWEKNKIMHNAGVKLHQMEQIFCKGTFRHTKPFGLSVGGFDRNICGIKYYEEIAAFTRSNMKIRNEISHQQMKVNFREKQVAEIAGRLTSLVLEEGKKFPQNDLLSIAIFLFHYGESTNSSSVSFSAKRILELAAEIPLSPNYTLSNGSVAFGIALEHLRKHGFIEDDIDEILEDLDAGCLAYFKNTDKLDLGNLRQVNSVLFYILSRSKNILDFAVVDQSVSLFADYYHYHYKGFLVDRKTDSLDMELAGLYVLITLLERHFSTKLALLVERLTHGILHYLNIRQNDVKLFTARILVTVVKANILLKHGEFKIQIDWAVNRYLNFISANQDKLVYPDRIDIAGGLGGILFDNILLMDLIGPDDRLKKIIRHTSEKTNDFFIHHSDHEDIRKIHSLSFINGVSELATVMMGASDPALLLKYRDFYMI